MSIYESTENAIKMSKEEVQRIRGICQTHFGSKYLITNHRFKRLSTVVPPT